MRRCYCFVLVISLCFVLLCCHLPVLGLSVDFETEELAEEERRQFEKFTNLSLLQNEPSKSAIDDFCVNEAGMIAIVSNERVFSFERTICVYDCDGVFQYGYSFQQQGEIAIEWEERQQLWIYGQRDRDMILINRQGEIQDYKRFTDTRENRTQWNAIKCADQQVGDKKYIIRNDMGIFNILKSSYSQVVMIDSDGREVVLYDVNAQQLAKALIWAISISVFILVIAIVFVFSLRKWMCRQPTENYKRYK